jgi:hypothetical protein
MTDMMSSPSISLDIGCHTLPERLPNCVIDGKRPRLFLQDDAERRSMLTGMQETEAS